MDGWSIVSIRTGIDCYGDILDRIAIIGVDIPNIVSLQARYAIYDCACLCLFCLFDGGLTSTLCHTCGHLADT